MMNRINDMKTKTPSPHFAPPLDASKAERWLGEIGLAQKDVVHRLTLEVRKAVDILQKKNPDEEQAKTILLGACYDLFYGYQFDFLPRIRFHNDEGKIAIEFDPFEWTIHIPALLYQSPEQFCSGFCAALRQAEHLIFLVCLEKESGLVTLAEMEHRFATRALQVNICRSGWDACLPLPASGRAEILPILRELLEKYGDFNHVQNDGEGEGYRIMSTIPEVLRRDIAITARKALSAQ
ncbi:hypothetical protein RGU70_12185 [Herbaspirillum sp. RTI4]|uniref:hypothetical protein n=1 Tax=Herbaspirillum sp. RTI4 TaxID=3048640 RepID=UPI002AB496B9|nr:hypothetical protein [Herbaspirillum sp. RTI4]MDY7579082.1 hypothetical protein [Herbaspirillum sp. RTI4]MEA9981339.1 hypothetical protein [Herbaspirillum sp. RTI4]